MAIEIEEGAVSKNRHLYLSDVNMESAAAIVAQLINWNDEDNEKSLTVLNYQRPPIFMHIMSYGGDVYSAKAIISAIRTTQAPVITWARGCAMSAGFLLFLFGDTRIADKYTTFMIHSLSATADGTMSDMKNDVKQYEKIDAELNEMVTSLTKIKKRELEKMIGQNVDWFMDAEEALKLGVCTQIV
jgi:ATP-dependent Clp protease, protease subunit